MQFRPIASSSAGCAYVLSADGLPDLLIECGVRFQQIQRALAFKTSQLAGCLISHSHGDHCASVSDLTARGIDCYASEETLTALRYASPHRAHVLTPHETHNVKGWNVMGFPVVHDAPGTLGFLVAAGSDKFLYLTDTAYSPFRFEGLTLIAVEANWSEGVMRQNHRDGLVHSERFRRTARNHMSLDRTIDMLRANDLSKCRAIHLLHLSDANSDEAEFVDKVARATGVPTYCAPAGLPSTTKATNTIGHQSGGGPAGADLDETLGQGRR